MMGLSIRPPYSKLIFRYSLLWLSPWIIISSVVIHHISGIERRELLQQPGLLEF